MRTGTKHCKARRRVPDEPALNETANMISYSIPRMPLGSAALWVALTLLAAFVCMPASQAQENPIAARSNHSLGQLRENAKRGEVEAQFRLGLSYETGEGVERDSAEAVKWYRLAAERGHAMAQNNLGVAYLRGRGVAQSDAEALKWFRKSAEQGEAFGQANMGYLYQQGKGVQRDANVAYQWIQKAADQAHPWAQLEIARRHLIPVGGSDPGPYYDPALGFKWLRAAANGGSLPAIVELADAYFRGIGTKIDLNAALACLRKAADAGHAGAQAELAAQYAFGNGEPRHEKETPVALLKKSAASGNPTALESLAHRYRVGFGVPMDVVVAIELYRRAAAEEDNQKQWSRYRSRLDLTARMLDEHGAILPQDTAELARFAEVVRTYDLAKKQRDAAAQMRLAQFYERGELVPRNSTLCYAWYSLAARQGNQEAVAQLERIRPKLSKEELEAAVSLARNLTTAGFSLNSLLPPTP
jgi:uncharacterized protein